MKCTMQWGKFPIGEDEDGKMQYRTGCNADATHEVRQNHRDSNGKILETTYHIGFNCDLHVPKRTAQNYIITEIK